MALMLWLQVENLLKKNKPGKMKAKKKNDDIADMSLTNKKIKIAVDGVKASAISLLFNLFSKYYFLSVHRSFFIFPFFFYFLFFASYFIHVLVSFLLSFHSWYILWE